MNIFNILNNDTEGLTDEEKVYAEEFNEKLRESLIDELVIYETNSLIKELKDNEEAFREKIEDIFINGKKGYKNIPTKVLIDIYLEKLNEGDFVNLIEKISGM